MQTFYLTKDELVNTWYRDYYEIEAESQEEAIEKILTKKVIPDDTEFLPISNNSSISRVFTIGNGFTDLYNSINDFDIVDNSKFIKDRLLELHDKNDFIWVQVIQRKKDGNILPAYTSGARNIRNFSFFDVAHFERDFEYIKTICDQNNARAYMWINPKNARDISCETAKHYLELIRNNNCYQGLTVWERECGLNYSKNYPFYWIVDIDTKNQELIDQYKKVILECRGSEDRIKYELPTLNGIHLLTSGFDRTQFYQKLKIYNLERIDIHKNSPTLLYYKHARRSL